MGVSDITIRRDLRRLKAGGYIKYTYGGAFSLEKLTRELSFDEKIVLNFNKTQPVNLKQKLSEK